MGPQLTRRHGAGKGSAENRVGNAVRSAWRGGAHFIQPEKCVELLRWDQGVARDPERRKVYLLVHRWLGRIGSDQQGWRICDLREHARHAGFAALAFGFLQPCREADVLSAVVN